MKTTAVLMLLTVALVATPVATASELNCSGTPTDTDLGDWAYQTTCSVVDFACEFVFDPCPLEPRLVD